MFDFFLIVASVLLFVVNTLVLKLNFPHWLIQGYLNDVLAGFVIVSYVHLVFKVSKFRIDIKSNIFLCAGIILMIGLFWEYGVLLYKPHSTPDVYDIVAYIVGMGFNIFVSLIFAQYKKLRSQNNRLN